MNRKGFTLVEVMAVIAILGILLVGGGMAISSVITHQKEKIKQENIKTIEDAAITYVLNKKYYVPVCKTSAGMVTINKDKVKEVNTIIENNNTYRGKRGDFKSLNSDTNLKAALSGASGKFGRLLDNNCYKLVSVDTLIKEGFVEKVNDCNVATNANHSVIVVYAMGDAADPTGAGQLVAVSDAGLCS